MFNSILWTGIAVSDSAVNISEYSIFQRKKEIVFSKYDRNLKEMKGFECKELNTLKWFAQDKYIVTRQSEDSLFFFVVKWGKADFTKTESKESFMFYTILVKDGDEVKADMFEPNFEKGKFNDLMLMLWNRMWEW